MLLVLGIWCLILELLAAFTLLNVYKGIERILSMLFVSFPLILYIVYTLVNFVWK